MKISPKEIIETVESKISTVLSDEIVTYDYIYTDDQIDIDGTKNFPRIYFHWNEAGALNENNNSMVLVFMFCDVMESKTNSKKKDYEIKSDMMQAASKLFVTLSREPFFETATPSFSYQPFSQRGNNGLAGVQVTVTFALEKPCYNV